MSIDVRLEVPHTPEEVWRYLDAPGAMARLAAPFLPMRPVSEAGSLRDREAVLAPMSPLPGPLGVRLGPVWRARHDRRGFVEGERFVDRCVSQPYAGLTAWVHEHTVEPVAGGGALVGGTLVGDRVTARVPRRFLEPVFAYRHRQLAADLRRIGETARVFDGPAPTVAVTGASGLVGRDLVALLGVSGHRVIRLVRGRPGGPDERHWDPDRPAPDLLEGVDVLVHLAGEPIAGRFTDAHLEKVRGSRVGPTRALAELVARRRGATALICASAIGFYGADRGDDVLGEEAGAGDGPLAGIVADWEAACDPAREAGARVVSVRTGLVLSGAGGLLPPLAAVTRTGLGGRLGAGRQWMSWIALDDLSDVYLRAVRDPGLRGPVNAVSPTPARNERFTADLGAVLRRPTPLPVPARATALLLGERGARELALADQRVAPTVLTAAGHRFRFDSLRPTLAYELGRDPR